MKIVTIVGARPQFIKAAPVSRAFAQHADVHEVMVHTGQHFDHNMSDVFFSQLRIRAPQHQLDIHGGSHGQMTGRMLEAIEGVIQAEEPELVLVYGDTNSTLAGALAAAKLHVPVAHVEAGLRSRDMRMPEEINRILTDNLSALLFCPTEAAVANLMAEGYSQRPVAVDLVGDVMNDAVNLFAGLATPPHEVTLPNGYVLATIHRAENTDDARRLAEIITGLNQVHAELAPVIVPLHPRTRGAIEAEGLAVEFHTIEPVGYLEMLWLIQHSELVATDSGGLQKEAYMLGKPCVTLRDSTEWLELIEAGVNVLAPAEAAAVVAACRRMLGTEVSTKGALYGDGRAADRIVARILGHRTSRTKPELRTA